MNSSSTETNRMPKADENSDKSSLIRGLGHSRESSGTSNLSVKFTVAQSSDGASPIASATVSTDTTPLHHQQLPAVAVRNPLKTTSNHRRKRRNRRPMRSDEANASDEECEPSGDAEGVSGETDVGEPRESAEMVNEGYGKSCDSLAPTDVARMLTAKKQNGDYGSFCNTNGGDGYLPSSRTNPAVPVTPSDGVKPSAKGPSKTAAGEGQTQPLLDNSPSDSSCSDDDAGANSSGYTRRKTRLHQRNSGGGASVAATGIVSIDITSETEVDGCEVRIPGEPAKTFLAFVFLFFAWVATTTSLALTHDRVPQVPPLPDVFLDNTTYQPWGLSVSEILIMVSTLAAFLVCLSHKHRCVVLRRVFLLVGLHYYYRAITMFITVVPKANPHYECAPRLNATELTPLIVAERVLKLLSGFGLSINGKHVYCGDYIYSGHTMTLVMTYLVIKGYSPKSWFLLHYASLCSALCGIVFLMLARGHYSIDVVVAYWITTRLWWMYHSMSNNRNLKDGKNSHNFLRKMWWWNIFLYFECNIPAPVPREYNWPIPDRLLRLNPFAASGDNVNRSDVEAGLQQ